jgi:hypothetical protein
LDGGFPTGEAGDFAPFLQFTVLSNAPPFVTITNPVEGAELDAGVEIVLAAEASDADGSITNVDFYAGTSEPLALLGSDTTAPYSVPWTTLNSNAAAVYTIRAIATDDTGQTSQDEIEVTVLPAFVELVSTAVGDGADVEMREQSNDSANSADMNVRTSPNGDRNEIIGLRFDLSGRTLANLNNVKLNLISYRFDTSTRYIRVYGVAQGTAAPEGSYTTENWDETAMGTFGTMPGLLATDGNELTQSIDTTNVTDLGQITVPSSSPKGGAVTFDTPALTTFIQNYSGSSKVTLLIAAGTPLSSGQFRIASKEATALDGGTPTGDAGDFAPYLEFQNLPSQPPEVTLTNPLDGATLDGGVEVILGADATDNDGSVTNVAFYAGTAEPLTFLGSDTTPPYSQAWTPIAVNPLNAYTIRVVATDDAGFSASDTISVTVTDPTLTAVTTAVGGGADTELREQDDPNAARNTVTDLNVRFNGTDRNEVVGLKFDLTGYTLAELNNVTINVVNYRTNDTHTIDVYGVTQGATGGTGAFSTETWADSGGSTITAWGDLPGLLVSDGNVATASLDTNNLTLLVDGLTTTTLDEGTVQPFSSAALTSFVQTYSGSSLVTFLLASGDPADGGQFRFASKEASSLTTLSGSAGDFAPYLSFTVGAVVSPPLEYSITGGGTGIEFSWAGSGFKLQSQTNNLGTGLSTNWVDYPGGNTSPVPVPIDEANGAVFFRLTQ